MSEPPKRLVICALCHVAFEREAWILGGRERFPDARVLCDKCEINNAPPARKSDAHHDRWLRYCPPDYHRARRELVKPIFYPALDWNPAEGFPRLGLWGEPGMGKSMTAALVVKSLGLRFRWINGSAARHIYNRSVTGNDPDSRRESNTEWRQLMDCPLLVLDDVDKGNFTEAWVAAVFSLLEKRNSNRLPTIWTANLGPGRLARKFAKCVETEMADAIERRLCQDALILPGG